MIPRDINNIPFYHVYGVWEGVLRICYHKS
jgi:hypothetical protein